MLRHLYSLMYKRAANEMLVNNGEYFPNFSLNAKEIGGFVLDIIKPHAQRLGNFVVGVVSPRPLASHGDHLFEHPLEEPVELVTELPYVYSSVPLVDDILAGRVRPDLEAIRQAMGHSPQETVEFFSHAQPDDQDMSGYYEGDLGSIDGTRAE